MTAPDSASAPSGGAEVVRFRPEWAPRFERLNREWIEQFFTMEAADRKLFEDPAAGILGTGGMIFFAHDGKEVIGTCGAIRLDAERFELAKMGVTARAQGGGIGRRLAEAAIAFAREAGAQQIVLFTSSRLGPALLLYRQLGFVEQPMPAGSAFARSDVFMSRALAD